VLSFGATKNGAICAEALIVFDPELASTLDRRRRRSGQMMSKMRFLSCQLEVYLDGGLWLRNAAHANAMAADLSARLARIPGVALAFPTQANLVFVDLGDDVAARLERAGYPFRRWAQRDGGRAVYRLVASFATQASEVDAIIAACERAAAGQAAKSAG
jgi:threonine aldolase